MFIPYLNTKLSTHRVLFRLWKSFFPKYTIWRVEDTDLSAPVLTIFADDTTLICSGKSKEDLRSNTVPNRIHAETCKL